MNREKVIKSLETCSDVFYGCKEACSSCAYSQMEKCFGELVYDAIALLKEQEAVEPSFKQDEKGIFIWCCGSCGAYMYHIYDGTDKAKEYAKYCRQCGKKVKWE